MSPLPRSHTLAHARTLAMFSGQFSKRKQVNLGGQSKTVDRASALAEARREREQRSRERARASAAVLLQVRDSALARSLAYTRTSDPSPESHNVCKSMHLIRHGFDVFEPCSRSRDRWQRVWRRACGSCLRRRSATLSRSITCCRRSCAKCSLRTTCPSILATLTMCCDSFISSNEPRVMQNKPEVRNDALDDEISPSRVCHHPSSSIDHGSLSLSYR